MERGAGGAAAPARAGGVGPRRACAARGGGAARRALPAEACALGVLRPFGVALLGFSACSQRGLCPPCAPIWPPPALNRQSIAHTPCMSLERLQDRPCAPPLCAMHHASITLDFAPRPRAGLVSPVVPVPHHHVHRYGQVVQLVEGLRLHHARRRRRGPVRAPDGDQVGGLPHAAGGREGRVADRGQGQDEGGERHVDRRRRRQGRRRRRRRPQPRRPPATRKWPRASRRRRQADRCRQVVQLGEGVRLHRAGGAGEDLFVHQSAINA